LLEQDPGHEEGRILYALVKRAIKERAGFFAEAARNIRGVSEETTTGGAPSLPDGSPKMSSWPPSSTSMTRSPRASSTTSTAAVTPFPIAKIKKLVMSNSFTNQTIAQLELWLASQGKPTLSGVASYEKGKVYTLPNILDEKVARLHLAKLGVELEVLTDAQAAYLGIAKTGPHKPELYRY
jgi:hypothetical protein